MCIHIYIYIYIYTLLYTVDLTTTIWEQLVVDKTKVLALIHVNSTTNNSSQLLIGSIYELVFSKY